MKKLLVLGLLVMFIMGCGQSAVRSEFWQHDTMYSSMDHMAFSWFGHRDPAPEAPKLASEQGWWGIEVPYVPGQ